MVKFSVITCTYNSKSYVKKNIDSVICQTYDNYEHIFVDGYSNDGTVNIINSYKDETKPGKVKLLSQKPGGISKAMNAGIKCASGEYLIHLHSDDSFYSPNVLESISEFLEKNNNLEWIYGKINVIEDDGITSVGLFPTKSFMQNTSASVFGKELLKYFNYIPHQGVFIKNEIFTKYGYFDEELKYGMDLDLWLRIKNITKWGFYDGIISNYMIREGAQSSGIKNSNLNYFNRKVVVERHLNIIEYNISILVQRILIAMSFIKR